MALQMLPSKAYHFSLSLLVSCFSEIGVEFGAEPGLNQARIGAVEGVVCMGMMIVIA
jgi:hypothetical protein